MLPLRQELAGSDPRLPERPGRGGAGRHQAEVPLRGSFLQRWSAVGGITQAVPNVQVTKITTTTVENKLK